MIDIITSTINTLLAYLRYRNKIKGWNIAIRNSSILSGAVINANIRIINSYISKNTHIHHNSTIVRCNTEGYHKIGKYANLFNTNIGKYTYLGDNVTIRNADIGKFCSIANFLSIGAGEHPIDFLSTSPVFYDSSAFEYSLCKEVHFKDQGEKTKIGNDVWVGERVFIKQGVIIGHGAIIGAGSVVTKDVPDYAIVGGVPAKTIRYRFSEGLINKLLELEWWNNDGIWLKDNIGEFQKSLNRESDLNLSK